MNMEVRKILDSVKIGKQTIYMILQEIMLNLHKKPVDQIVELLEVVTMNMKIFVLTIIYF